LARSTWVSITFFALSTVFLIVAGIISLRPEFRQTQIPAQGSTPTSSEEEHAGIVTRKGKPVTLLGNQISTGETAPDFALTANDLATVTLANSAGKVRIISVVPSLDTPVCDAQTRRFNQEAAGLGPDIAILTVSMDLPFAQRRWCAAAGITAVQTLSDYKNHTFGRSYGVRVKELGLLARSVFVVDRSGRIAYKEIVKDISTEPDYAKAISAARQAL
jgi:thiol peroxidase